MVTSNQVTLTVIAPVTPTTLTLAESANTITSGQSVQLTGTLTDQNGNAIAGATVTLYLNGLNTNNSSTTNANGQYAITAYFNTPGTYTLTTVE